MSGPKRADVEAQLRVARNGQRSCAGLIAAAEKKALQSLLQTGADKHRQAADAARRASQMLDGLSPEAQGAAGDSVSNARASVQEALRLASTAESVLGSARSAVEAAGSQERAADATYGRANTALNQAEESLRQSGGHYLRSEMAGAEAATALFNQAQRELDTAARSRGTASQNGNQAVKAAEQALSAAREAVSRVQATQAEAEARLRAEVEARRIAEENRRNASLAVDGAGSAYARLADLPHAKFRPGAGQEVKAALDEARRLFGQGDWDVSKASAERVQKRARDLEREVVEAQREHERRRADAQSHLQSLVAALQGTDGALVREWSDEPQAFERAQAARDATQVLVEREEFEAAGSKAREALEPLAQATRTAAENKSQHEVREQIGEAVMDVLQEMDFDVSSADGSRTEPLRINAQTPDTGGRGDFDISIPLSGEVDFHISTPDGDTSCVEAVQQLQQRLAARGIGWNTTDWGHAQGAQGGSFVNATQQQKENVKFKGKG